MFPGPESNPGPCRKALAYMVRALPKQPPTSFIWHGEAAFCSQPKMFLINTEMQRGRMWNWPFPGRLPQQTGVCHLSSAVSSSPSSVESKKTKTRWKTKSLKKQSRSHNLKYQTVSQQWSVTGKAGREEDMQPIRWTLTSTDTGVHAANQMNPNLQIQVYMQPIRWTLTSTDTHAANQVNPNQIQVYMQPIRWTLTSRYRCLGITRQYSSFPEFPTHFELGSSISRTQTLFMKTVIARQHRS